MHGTIKEAAGVDRPAVVCMLRPEVPAAGRTLGAIGQLL